MQFNYICEVNTMNANLEIVKLKISDVITVSGTGCDPDCDGETEII